MLKTQLIAKGKVLILGKIQIIAEMRCWDENHQLIAHITGTNINLKKEKQE
jgi:acyl-coenzyme A thioesterase PaaI-like protein